MRVWLGLDSMRVLFSFRVMRVCFFCVLVHASFSIMRVWLRILSMRVLWIIVMRVWFSIDPCEYGSIFMQVLTFSHFCKFCPMRLGSQGHQDWWPTPHRLSSEAFLCSSLGEALPNFLLNVFLYFISKSFYILCSSSLVLFLNLFS